MPATQCSASGCTGTEKSGKIFYPVQLLRPLVVFSIQRNVKQLREATARAEK